MGFLEEYKEFDKKLWEIAKIYADTMQKTNYSSVISVSYSPKSNSTHFYFVYQPSSSGIGGNASLPISLVNEQNMQEKIEQLAMLKLQEYRESKEKNTCKSCGNSINRNMIYYSGDCNVW